MTAIPTTSLREFQPGDAARILELNAASVDKLSPLDAAALAALQAQAALARVATCDGDPCGFLIALREGTDYASPNYRWFAERYDAFLYIDRVVVDAACRGRGIARRLYADAFAHARAHGLELLACEYDVEPPNPASGALHAALGFHEAGRQRLAVGKVVSLQVAPVMPRA